MSDPGATFRSLSRVESGILGEDRFHRFYVDEKAGGGLTIFIPAWNHRPYLPRSLRSSLTAVERLKEAGFQAEVLVVDDASRDGSQRLLRTVQALYVNYPLRTFFQEHNLGVARLRNLALRLSRFRYVCMLDADDELLPDNLPIFLKSIIDTDAALVHGNLIAREGDRTVLVKSGRKASMQLTEGSYIDAIAVVDAEKLLRVGGYDPWFYSGEDWELALHLISEEQKIVFVPAVLAYYHRNPMSKFREARSRREVLNALARRVYAQTGPRGWDPLKVGWIYHPDIGYIDGA